MRRYLLDVTRALLELCCALTGHARSCLLLNRGPTGRLYAWAMSAPLRDWLEQAAAPLQDEAPVESWTGCLKCERAWEGQMLACPEGQCPLLHQPLA